MKDLFLEIAHKGDGFDQAIFFFMKTNYEQYLQSFYIFFL